MKEREDLYPEEEMMIEQESYRAFLEVAEYGKAGIECFISKFNELSRRTEVYEQEE